MGPLAPFIFDKGLQRSVADAAAAAAAAKVSRVACVDTPEECCLQERS